MILNVGSFCHNYVSFIVFLPILLSFHICSVWSGLVTFTCADKGKEEW